MGYQPRMRGTRFRRPATKKLSTKEKRREQKESIFYQEPIPVDPQEISSRASNALEHLGGQRFALPPFSEHFQRWVKDVRSTLADFETEVPGAADKTYQESLEKILKSVEDALGKRIQIETGIYEEESKLQQELNTCELELSKLEHEYKAQAQEVRKRYERGAEKLLREIDSLGKERSDLLRKTPTLIERIFHRPNTRVEKSTNALQLKKNDLGNKKALLKHDLDNLRADYAIKRKKLTEHQEKLRTKLMQLRQATLDDALDIRKQASQEVRQVMAEAINRLLAQGPSAAENIQ